jgi:hypothetical protein
MSKSGIPDFGFIRNIDIFFPTALGDSTSISTGPDKGIFPFEFKSFRAKSSNNSGQRGESSHCSQAFWTRPAPYCSTSAHSSSMVSPSRNYCETRDVLFDSIFPEIWASNRSKSKANSRHGDTGCLLIPTIGTLLPKSLVTAH